MFQTKLTEFPPTLGKMAYCLLQWHFIWIFSSGSNLAFHHHPLKMGRAQEICNSSEVLSFKQNNTFFPAPSEETDVF